MRITFSGRFNFHFFRLPDLASLVTNELAQNESRSTWQKMKNHCSFICLDAFSSSVTGYKQGYQRTKLCIYLSLKSMMKVLLFKDGSIQCIIMWVVLKQTPSSLKWSSVWRLYCNSILAIKTLKISQRNKTCVREKVIKVDCLWLVSNNEGMWAVVNFGESCFKLARSGRASINHSSPIQKIIGPGNRAT